MAMAMEITPESTVKVMEQSRVAPPFGSVAETHIPLTFFDVPWLKLLAMRGIFFFDLSRSSAQNFQATHLPNLKKSLSLALQHFYPLAATLAISSQTGEHEIHYADGDSVQLTVAESDMDFQALVADGPKDTAWFHPLSPELPDSDLISFQLTVFPNSGGFSIAHTVHHVVGDGRSILHFMKHWASICRLGHVHASSYMQQLPIHDRTLIPDPKGLKRILLDRMKMGEREEEDKKKRPETIPTHGTQQKEPMVRATFKMSPAQIEELRQRAHLYMKTMIMTAADHNDEGDEKKEKKKPIRYSSFVVTSAYVWVCLTKVRGVHNPHANVHFGFSADCRGPKRMNPSIPVSYFGNCIIMCIASAKVSDIIVSQCSNSQDIAYDHDKDDEGFGAACEVIRKEIERLEEDDDLRGSDGWFWRLLSILGSGERLLSVAGSPRIGFYEMDFGHGRPRKMEVISIEDTGALSLAESRDEEGVDEGGIEVGLALPKHVLERFITLYHQGLIKNH